MPEDWDFDDDVEHRTAEEVGALEHCQCSSCVKDRLRVEVPRGYRLSPERANPEPVPAKPPWWTFMA